MEYICAGYSDKGNVKKVNEDNLCFMKAQTDHGQILMAMVCDGVGGLSNGEKASSNTIQYFVEWFEERLPALLQHFSWDSIREQWETNVDYINRELLYYSEKNHVSLGTTMIIALFYQDKIMMMNVGDSRLYEVKDDLIQLSKDQSVVQREVDLGKLRPDQMETDPRRNILLQCIGATRKLIPEIRLFPVKKDCMYFLCSDGFRHKLTEGELISTMNPAMCTSEAVIQQTIENLVDLVKRRQEQDNISVIAVRTREG